MKPSKSHEILRKIYHQLLDFEGKDHTPDAVKNISYILDEYGSFGKFFDNLNFSNDNEKYDAFHRVINEFQIATSIDHAEHDRFMNELNEFARHDIDIATMRGHHEFNKRLAVQYRQENPRTVSGTPPALWDMNGNLIKSPSIYSVFLAFSVQHQAEEFFKINHSAWINACASLTSMGDDDRRVIASMLTDYMAHQNIGLLDKRRLALRPFFNPKAELRESISSMSLLNCMADHTPEVLRSKVQNFIDIAQQENEIALAKELIEDHVKSIYQTRAYAPEHRTSTSIYITMLDAYADFGFDIQELRDCVFGNYVTPTRSMIDILIDNLNPAKDGECNKAIGANVIAGAFFEKLGNQILLESEIDQDRLLNAYIYTKSSAIKEKLMETDRVVEVLAMDLGL